MLIYRVDRNENEAADLLRAGCRLWQLYPAVQPASRPPRCVVIGSHAGMASPPLGLPIVGPERELGPQAGLQLLNVCVSCVESCHKEKSFLFLAANAAKTNAGC